MRAEQGQGALSTRYWRPGAWDAEPSCRPRPIAVSHEATHRSSFPTSHGDGTESRGFVIARHRAGSQESASGQRKAPRGAFSADRSGARGTGEPFRATGTRRGRSFGIGPFSCVCARLTRAPCSPRVPPACATSMPPPTPKPRLSTAPSPAVPSFTPASSGVTSEHVCDPPLPANR